MKYSKGPWKFNSDRTILSHNDGIKIIDVTTGVEPIKEDAALIAAAPDLLELLIENWSGGYCAMETREDEDPDKCFCLHCRTEALIYKAKNEKE